MKPYSIDLRQKIIKVYEQENISIRKLAQRFQVSKSFIQKLIKQYRETGDINPQVQGGSPPNTSCLSPKGSKIRIILKT